MKISDAISRIINAIQVNTLQIRNIEKAIAMSSEIVGGRVLFQFVADCPNKHQMPARPMAHAVMRAHFTRRSVIAGT